MRTHFHADKTQPSIEVPFCDGSKPRVSNVACRGMCRRLRRAFSCSSSGPGGSRWGGCCCCKASTCRKFSDVSAVTYVAGTRPRRGPWPVSRSTISQPAGASAPTRSQSCSPCCTLRSTSVSPRKAATATTCCVVVLLALRTRSARTRPTVLDLPEVDAPFIEPGSPNDTIRRGVGYPRFALLPPSMHVNHAMSTHSSPAPPGEDAEHRICDGHVGCRRWWRTCAPRSEVAARLLLQEPRGHRHRPVQSRKKVRRETVAPRVVLKPVAD